MSLKNLRDIFGSRKQNLHLQLLFPACTKGKEVGKRRNPRNVVQKSNKKKYVHCGSLKRFSVCVHTGDHCGGGGGAKFAYEKQTVFLKVCEYILLLQKMFQVCANRECRSRKTLL